MKKGLPESRILIRLGKILREICDTWRVPEKKMVGIVLESCWSGDFAKKVGAAPNAPAVDKLAARFGG